MSTPITFDPNQAAEWLTTKGWTNSQEGVLDGEIRHLLDDASAEGIFGDVTIQLGHLGGESMVIVTLKNPAAVTRVISPTFSAGDAFPASGQNDHEAALTVLTVVAEKAAEAVAPLTSYVVSWTGGYEAPSFHQHATLAGAKAQVAGWINNENTIKDEDGDQLYILEVSAGSPTVTVVAVGERNADNEYVMVTTHGVTVV